MVDLVKAFGVVKIYNVDLFVFFRVLRMLSTWSRIWVKQLRSDLKQCCESVILLFGLRITKDRHVLFL